MYREMDKQDSDIYQHLYLASCRRQRAAVNSLLNYCEEGHPCRLYCDKYCVFSRICCAEPPIVAAVLFVCI